MDQDKKPAVSTTPANTPPALPTPAPAPVPTPTATSSTRKKFALSRETKLGLVVAGSFLALAGGVMGVKSYFHKGPEAKQEEVAVVEPKTPERWQSPKTLTLQPDRLPIVDHTTIQDIQLPPIQPVGAEIPKIPEPEVPVIVLPMDPMKTGTTVIVPPAESLVIPSEPIKKELPPVTFQPADDLAPPPPPRLKDDFSAPKKQANIKDEAPKPVPDPIDLPPVIEIKPPVPEVKLPAIEIKPPTIEFKPPESEVKPPVIDPLKPEVKNPVIRIGVGEPPAVEPPPAIDPPMVKKEAPPLVVDPPMVKKEAPPLVVDPPMVKKEAPPLVVDPPMVKKEAPPMVEAPPIRLEPAIEFAPKKEDPVIGVPAPKTEVRKDTEYDEDLHSIKPNETYKAISKTYYNSDAYAIALQRYNRDHPGQADYVRIPPIWLLEKKYTADIATTGTRAVNFSAPPAVEAAPQNQAVYTVADNGEMLADIARKQLGSEESWKRIWELNPQVNPAKMLPGGTRLRMP
ncbi:MAG: hypothetical protein K8T89_24385 [Planctomycetes bacterium]|nr:hypothetical protein [Planctomycetota bacterium]